MNEKAQGFSILFKNGMSRIKSRFENIYIPTWFTPFALAFIVILSYGLKISELGFYWDGWPFIYFFNRLGPDRFVEIQGDNRPLTALILAQTTRIFKDVPIRWQIFGLICRWTSAVALWWTLRQLWQVFWPKRLYQVTWIALLFVIYPSFTQQSIAIVYSPILILFSLIIISFGAMVKANRGNHWFWWLVSWVCAGYNMFALEYFIGLEFLRPILLWLLNGKEKIQKRKHLEKTLLQWSPYLVLMILRFFALPMSNYGVGVIASMESEPFGTMVVFLQTVFSDLMEVTFLAWEQAFQGPFLLIGKSETQILYRWVLAVAGVFCLLFLLKVPTELSEKAQQILSTPGNKKVLILFGVACMVCAGVPFWAVPLDLDLRFPENRFTLPLMIGASITLVGLIESVSKSKLKKIIIMALLVSAAAGFHLRTAVNYQIESRLQKDFIWNLVWRIPSLKPGTLILADGFPFEFSDDEAAASLINLAYQSDNQDEVLPYSFLFITGALGDELPALEKGLPTKQDFGPLNFTGSTSQAILVYYSGDSCLRVLNPEYDDLGQKYPGFLSEGIPLSDPNNILEVNGKINKRNLFMYFGEEPPSTWCYRYQKAELARQYGQWDRIVKIGDLVFKYDYLYHAPEELFPFIEGYAMTGNFKRAAELTYEALSNTRTLRPELCKIWERVNDAKLPVDNVPFIFDEVYGELDCSSFN